MDILSGKGKGQSTLEYLLLFVGVILVIYFVAVGEDNTYSIRKGYKDIVHREIVSAGIMAHRHRSSLGCKKPGQSCTRDLECCSEFCFMDKC